jgi:hypothetical protein
MMDQSLIGWVGVALAGSAIGMLVGAIHFRHLRHVAECCIAGASLPSCAIGSILRVGGTLLTFLALIKWSPIAALSGLAGFTLSRQWTFARTKGA